MDVLRKVTFLLVLTYLAACSTAYQGVEGRIQGAGNHNSLIVTIALAEDELFKNAQGFYHEPPEMVVVKKVRMDDKGNYKASLQPGVYSLLVETPMGWYATPSDSNQVLNKITIERKQVVTKDIVIRP